MDGNASITVLGYDELIKRVEELSNKVAALEANYAALNKENARLLAKIVACYYRIDSQPIRR